MRVLMVNRSDAETMLGGDTVQMRATAAGLRDLGVEVDEALGPQDEARMAGYDLVHLFNLQTPEFSVGEARKAKAAGRPLAVSTIFWDFRGEQLLAASPRWKALARLLGEPLALRLARRRVVAQAPRDRLNMAEILASADVLLPNSRAEVEHLQRLLPRLPPTVVVPNGIDRARFDPARTLPRPAWAPEGDYLLVVARIDPDKNQLAFCRAVASLPMPVFLVGTVKEPAYAEACAAGARLVGPLAGDDLDAAYRHARVHALPSFRETPGLASLEAAAMGCAIATTRFGSAHEYFGEEAEYLDPRDPGSMRGAVERAWARGRSETLARRIRETYDWSVAAQRTLEAYGAVLGRSR